MFATDPLGSVVIAVGYLAIAVFLLTASYHGFSATIPVVLAVSGTPDPWIGLVVGSAPIAQFAVALLIGPLLDRLGGNRIMAIGVAAYVMSCAVIAVAPPSGSIGFYLLARGLQGLGLAATLPTALWRVPIVVREERRAVAIALISSAFNVSAIVVIPASMFILTHSSLQNVAVLALISAVLGAAVFARQLGLQRTDYGAPEDADPPFTRATRFAILKRSWIGPLLAIGFYVLSFGVLTAYVPSRAVRANVDVSLFFVADAASVVVLRVLVGLLLSRLSIRLLTCMGFAAGASSVLLALLPTSSTTLLVAGLASGCAAAFIVTTNLVALIRRSPPAARGSAVSLYSATTAAGQVVGTAGLAPLVSIAGFPGAALVALVGLGIGALIATRDGESDVVGPQPLL